MTSKESFSHLEEWLGEVRASAPTHTEIIAFGNKTDLVDEIEVTPEDMQAFTERTGIKVIPCSAKNASNVEKGFIELTSKLVEKRIVEGDSTYNQLNAQFFDPAYT